MSTSTRIFIAVLVALTVFAVGMGVTKGSTISSTLNTNDRGVVDVSATANTGVNISGRVLDPDAIPAAGDLIEIESVGGDGGKDVTTNATGEFSAEVTPNGTYNVEFHQDSHNGPRDDVADLYAIDRFEVGAADIDMGTVTVPNASVLNITVVNESGAPIENAEVAIEHRNGAARAHTGGATDANGRAVIGVTVGVEVNGTVRVNVEPPEGSDYLHRQLDLTVTGEEHITVVLHRGVNVTGAIEQHDGTPAMGARVKFHDRPATFVEQVPTNSSGAFTARVAANQTYNVQYDQNPPTRDGYVDVYAIPMIDVGTSNVSLGTITLPRAHLLNVTVVDSNGMPVENALIDLTHDDEASSAWSTAIRETNANGTMIDPDTGFAGIEINGTVTLRVEPPSGSDFTRNRTQVRVTGDTEIVVVLKKALSVRGRFVKTDGSPAATDFTTANPIDTDSIDEVVIIRTSSDGRFAFEIESNRTYDFRVFQFNESGRHLGQRDGTVDVYAINRRSFSSDTDLGNVTLPQGHVLNVLC